MRRDDGLPDDAVVPWLLRGDPAIRWQVMRDLLDAPDRRVARERRKVAREGWGARLLARQDARGAWAVGRSSEGGLYSPKWISTTYTMLLHKRSRGAPDLRAIPRWNRAKPTGRPAPWP